MKLQNGTYHLSGNVALNELVEKYGCPLYVYDSEVIKRQYNKLKDAFTYKKIKLNYACKALTNINILKYVRSLGAGLDCVSVQEVKLGLMAGYAPEDILYTPNCISMDEIEECVGLGVKINIDNTSILEQFGHQFPDYPVCVRINPHIMAGGNTKISTGHIDSKFGISVYQMPLVKRIIKATGLRVNGMHMHTGSEILDVDVYLRGADILLNAAMDFDGLDYIDLGSGFKVSYKNDGIETDIKELGSKLTERFEEFCEAYGKELTLEFEPGKYLVSEAGLFLVKVNVVKQTVSTVFAGVDSGLNHLIRPMFYDAYHEISNISNPEGKKRIYTVVGYICETDTFGVNRKIPEVREGDILAFQNAGAYCYMMSSNYNSRFRPAEVMIYEGKDYLIRKRETMDDIIKNQIEHEIFEPAIQI
ncbi:MAG: diaminopimelate decarboxylase [Saprospiraceae bacterium]|nr:diaminopimelate decarboxylase [Saprospiraceae bacterium]